MTHKSIKVAAMVEAFQGRELPAEYLGYFECFNRGLFYESHDVLEALWLAERAGPHASFYKGLIQFAGAFVHLQRHTPERPRLKPAIALLKLARANIERYPAVHQQLDTAALLRLIGEWVGRIEAADPAAEPLKASRAPRLSLLEGRRI